MNPLLFLASDLRRPDVFDTARAAHQTGREVYVIYRLTQRKPMRWQDWIRLRA